MSHQCSFLASAISVSKTTLQRKCYRSGAHRNHPVTVTHRFDPPRCECRPALARLGTGLTMLVRRYPLAVHRLRERPFRSSTEANPSCHPDVRRHFGSRHRRHADSGTTGEQWRTRAKGARPRRIFDGLRPRLALHRASATRTCRTPTTASRPIYVRQRDLGPPRRGASAASDRIATFPSAQLNAKCSFFIRIRVLVGASMDSA